MQTIPSEELSRQKDLGGFDEIHEVARVITLYDESKRLQVRINIWRYYHPGGGVSYSAYYERELDDGTWEDADYGQVLSGSDSEETTIRQAVYFVRDAHKIRGRSTA